MHEQHVSGLGRAHRRLRIVHVHVAREGAELARTAIARHLNRSQCSTSSGSARPDTLPGTTLCSRSDNQQSKQLSLISYAAALQWGELTYFTTLLPPL